MACNTVYKTMDLHCWVVGPDALDLSISRDRSWVVFWSPRLPPFMCRIYLVAYKFRFDFILWREPSERCASGCNARRRPVKLNNCGISTTSNMSHLLQPCVWRFPLQTTKRPAQTRSVSYSSTDSFACRKKASRASRSDTCQQKEGQIISSPSRTKQRKRFRTHRRKQKKPGVS
jgi:hypothetical protein